MEIPASFFHVSFNKAMAFGYKTEDVDDFVTQAIQYIHDLQDENATLMEKMGVLADNLGKYREEEDSLRSALVGAQKLGDSILRDCRGKAEAIMRDANARADKVTQDAADELARTQYELDGLRCETTEFKEQLFTLYRAHLAHINNLPSSKESSDNHRKTPPPPAPVAAVPEPEPEPELAPEPAQQESYPHDNGAGYDAPANSHEQPAPVEDDLANDYYEQPEPKQDDYYDFPEQPATDDDFDNEFVDGAAVEYTEITYDEELPVMRETLPADDSVVQAVAADDNEEKITTYQPRTRGSDGGRRGKGGFEPLPMVQMEFFEDEQEEEEEPDGFFADAENLRSVDLNKIPYFDDEDDEEDEFGAQPASGKHRISKKFGELKFGESFNLTDD